MHSRPFPKKNRISFPIFLREGAAVHRLILLCFFNLNLVTTHVNGHFWRCMLKPIRNAKFGIIKVSYTMRFLFLMFVTAVCVLFLLAWLACTRLSVSVNEQKKLASTSPSLLSPRAVFRNFFYRSVVPTIMKPRTGYAIPVHSPYCRVQRQTPYSRKGVSLNSWLV